MILGRGDKRRGERRRRDLSNFTEISDYSNNQVNARLSKKKDPLTLRATEVAATN